MIDFFARIFIKNYEDTGRTEVRRDYGVLCGRLGIFFNLLLFALKITTGFFSGSIAVVTDAFNNLSDIGSSLVMIIGFRMSAEKPDTAHPFGHGRLEYITGLIVSIIVILMGIELIKTSVEKILAPTEVSLNDSMVLILIASIIIKLFMYSYNNSAAEKLRSTAMHGVAIDSFVDSVATSVVLLTIVVNNYLGLRIDGWCGLLLSFFILYSGLASARDTIDPLLGGPIDKEFAERIRQFVESYDGILGMHDLLVHDYGPGRLMISLHAEVPADGDLIKLHDTIDNIEHKLREVLGCYAVIHMDPVVVNDWQSDELKETVERIVQGIEDGLSMHDFRMVAGPTHNNLIFDVIVPFESPLSDEEVREQIRGKISELPGNYYAIIDIDKPFIKEK